MISISRGGRDGFEQMQVCGLRHSEHRPLDIVHPQPGQSHLICRKN
jgi:hypothetical protein